MQRGSSYIEVVFALLLLAMFGSSLFFTQQYVFGRLAKARAQLIATSVLKESLLQFGVQVIEKFFAGEDVLQSELVQQKRHIDKYEADIELRLEKPAEQSVLKDFKQLYILRAKIKHELFEEESVRFLMIPDIPSKEKS